MRTAERFNKLSNQFQENERKGHLIGIISSSWEPKWFLADHLQESTFQFRLQDNEGITTSKCP